jgi:hypothetical protein
MEIYGEKSSRRLRPTSGCSIREEDIQSTRHGNQKSRYNFFLSFFSIVSVLCGLAEEKSWPLCSIILDTRLIVAEVQLWLWEQHSHLH